MFHNKVDGKWSGWGNWDHFRACSETCGHGVRYRYRYRACDNPEPQNGGKKCPGPLKDEDFKRCFLQKCPSKTYEILILVFRLKLDQKFDKEKKKFKT